MEGMTMQMVIEIVSQFGLPGCVLLLWWMGEKSHQRTLSAYREDTQEMRRMYESNVRLVEKYEALSTDLREVVMVNTQTFSELTDAIKHNQFCPIVRKEGGTY